MLSVCRGAADVHHAEHDKSQTSCKPRADESMLSVCRGAADVHHAEHDKSQTSNLKPQTSLILSEATTKIPKGPMGKVKGRV